ncbi:MAG: SEC-C metal-binding domain-containing protein [Pseudonocardiaceae bacterium]
MIRRGDPTDPQVRQDYAEHVNEHHRKIWPPGRNETCWCGSGAKYKKCCLPRARS